MPGQDSQTQQQTQNSVTAPWAAAQPLLTNLLGSYGGLNTGVTPGQTAATNNLQTAANTIPNFGSMGATTLGNLSSSSTAPQVGMLSDAYGTLKSNLSGVADPNNVNPYNTPGFSDALNTMTGNITNATKGVYAGSGRDPSGAGSFAKSLSLGLLQGEAPVLQSQYNTNVGNMLNANTTLNNAAGTTAGGITAQQQVPLANQVSAINAAPAVSAAYTAPATAQLGAANAAYAQPYQNLGLLEQPAAQLGSLGGQSTGTSNGTVSQSQNPLSNILGGLSGGIGLLSFLSDEKVKDDVKEVGKLHDGQKVYSFRYKGEPRTQIGLLAQEVEKHAPAAVSKVPGVGLLAVDYAKATARAAQHKRAA